MSVRSARAIVWKGSVHNREAIGGIDLWRKRDHGHEQGTSEEDTSGYQT